jgi:hypothetical protein
VARCVKEVAKVARLQYVAVMRKYQKITLEIEIVGLTDKEITPEQLTKLASQTRKGLKEALYGAKISHGGISMRTIVDEASLSEVNKIHKELTGK